jgi:5-(carboxyamino)imidazole ribonucleotide synthase
MIDQDQIRMSDEVTVGILGGGQLALMMALAGIPLGFRFIFLDPSENACASSAGRLLQAEYSDQAKSAELANQVDIATFDFENIPAESADLVSNLTVFSPPVSALGVCQDRLSEKSLLSELGISVPSFRPVDTRPELLAAIDHLGLPVVLKTRRLGYDGKGQAVLRQMEDLERAWQRLGQSELIVETFVPFDAECSLISVRSRDGQTRFWPLVHNIHHNGVLVLSQPGVFSQELQRQAEAIARLLLEEWQYIGVMTIEFFIQKGQLMVNEIAPRVHNSGHWTIDGALTSQFENHIRAIAGLPLGDTRMNTHSVMFNWLGELPDKHKALAVPGMHWHEYGKSARPGRKLGHATITSDQREDLSRITSLLADELGGSWPQLTSKLLPA